MAHRNTHTHRRILASPDPPNPSSSSLDPTLKNHHLPTATKNPDPHFPSKYSDMSKLYTKTPKKPTKNLPLDSNLQAKAMTVSADFHGSRFPLAKPKHLQQHRTIEPVLEKERIVTAKKEATLQKVKKLSSKESVVVVVEKKKVHDEKKKNNTAVKDLLEGIDIKRMSVSLGHGGGRTRSFCGSQVGLADFLATNGAKVVAVDMPHFMQIHAVDCARKTHDSLEKFSSKSLALTLKKEFDGVYGPAWHCIVGTSFGSFVTHSVGGFLYFSIDQKLYVLLFKTTVQRAD